MRGTADASETTFVWSAAAGKSLNGLTSAMPYDRFFSALFACPKLTDSVTAMPCTANFRAMRFPSSVGSNFAAARLASARRRPDRDSGGVSVFSADRAPGLVLFQSRYVSAQANIVLPWMSSTLRSGF